VAYSRLHAHLFRPAVARITAPDTRYHPAIRRAFDWSSASASSAPGSDVIVQGGSAHFPLEYLRLTVDTRHTTAPFSWERVVPTLAP
jgi:hypothetical protein